MTKGYDVGRFVWGDWWGAAGGCRCAAGRAVLEE